MVSPSSMVLSSSWSFHSLPRAVAEHHAAVQLGTMPYHHRQVARLKLAQPPTPHMVCVKAMKRSCSPQAVTTTPQSNGVEWRHQAEAGPCKQAPCQAPVGGRLVLRASPTHSLGSPSRRVTHWKPCAKQSKPTSSKSPLPKSRHCENQQQIALAELGAASATSPPRTAGRAWRRERLALSDGGD